jgi:hypothetical protein
MANENINQTFENTQSQLNVLQEIKDICCSLNINFWLRGGWAIDFLLGEITRQHSDIDLVSLTEQRHELEQSLLDAEFHLIPISEFQTDFLKEGVDISFVFVRKRNDGRIIANGFPDWEWRTDALQTQKYSLQGISANVLSPQQLLEEKEVYEMGTGRKPRPKDFESMKILRKIIDTLS